jgi:cytochrome c-type biogenesis protein CcmH/NrfG
MSMKNNLLAGFSPGRALDTSQAYIMAGLSLLIGLAIGYVLHAGHAQPVPQPVMQMQSAMPMQNAAATPAPVSQKQPSLEDIHKMADAQASPLLNKLKSDPNNSKVLEQIGATYNAGHQFKLAAQYYGKASQADPKNTAVRVKYAGALYESGDANSAISQLNQVLAQEPNNANALFNIGAIKLNSQKDEKSAIAAWKLLLKTNPQLAPDRKAQVEHLIQELEAKNAQKPGTPGTPGPQGAANETGK